MVFQKQLLLIYLNMKPKGKEIIQSIETVWIGQKFHFGFSIQSYGKTQMNILTNLVFTVDQVVLLLSNFPGNLSGFI